MDNSKKTILCILSLLLTYFTCEINALHKKSVQQFPHMHRRLQAKTIPSHKAFPINFYGLEGKHKQVGASWQTVRKSPTLKNMIKDLGFDEQNPPTAPLPLTLFSQKTIQDTFNLLDSYDPADKKITVPNILQNDSFDRLTDILKALTYLGIDKSFEKDYLATLLSKMQTMKPRDLLESTSIDSLDRVMQDKLLLNPIINNLAIKLINEYRPNDHNTIGFGNLDGEITSMEINNDGTHIVTATDSSRGMGNNESANLVLYDIYDDGKIKEKYLKNEHDFGSITTVASSDGTKFVSYSNILNLWDISNFDNPESYKLKDNEGIDKIYLHPNAMAFSNNGKLFACGGSQLSLWDVSDPKNAYQINSDIFSPFDKTLVASVAFNPDGTQMLIGCYIPFKLILWDIRNLEKVIRYDLDLFDGLDFSAKKISFSPDGTKIIVLGMNKKELIVWDINNLNDIKPYHLKGHIGSIIDAAWSPDSTKIISCSDNISGADLPMITDNPWMPTYQEQGLLLWDISDLTNIKQYDLNNKKNVNLAEVYSVAFSHYGGHVISGGSQLILWNIANTNAFTSKILQLPGFLQLAHNGDIKQIKLSSDGTHLLSSSSGKGHGHELMLWNLIKKETLRELHNIKQYDTRTLKLLFGLSVASLNNKVTTLSDNEFALTQPLPESIRKLLLFKRDPSGLPH